MFAGNTFDNINNIFFTEMQYILFIFLLFFKSKMS